MRKRERVIFESNSLSKYERIILEMYISMNDSMKGKPIKKTVISLIVDVVIIILMSRTDVLG